MSIIAMLSKLDDAGLGNLLSNARRLAAAGASKQRSAAEEMLPMIEAELAARQAASPGRTKAAKTGRKPKSP